MGIQVGMGYLGIDFLTNEQIRKNELVRMELISENYDKNTSRDEKTHSMNDGPEKLDKKDEQLGSEEKMRKSMLTAKSKKFRYDSVSFILFTVIPYMLQIIVLGNINKFAFICFRDDLHRAVRLNELFDNDSHLPVMAKESAVSPA